MDEAESELRTDDEWTLVQCKCRGGCKCAHKVGLTGLSKYADEDDKYIVRDQNRFTLLNDDGTTLKESNHEREGKRVRFDVREGNTITIEVDG